jgi:hypothetical protein
VCASGTSLFVFSSRMYNVPRKVSNYLLFIDFIFLYLALDCIVSHVWCLFCIYVFLYCLLFFSSRLYNVPYVVSSCRISLYGP